MGFHFLGNSRWRHRDQLRVYHPSHTKPVRKPPGAIIEFHEMYNQETLLAEAISGAGNGRRSATDFIADLHRDAPDTYTVDFIVDVWEMMSIYYMEIAREGVRRMGPYLEAHTTKIGLRKVELSSMYTKSGKTCTFLARSKTWKVDSEMGY